MSTSRHGRSSSKRLAKAAADHSGSIALDGLKGAQSLRLLEQRIVFDGAALVTHADTTAGEPSTAPGADADGHGSGSAGELLAALAETPAGAAHAAKVMVFIDAAVDDPAIIAAAAPIGAEIVMLDAGQDGLEQIAAHLAGRTGIDAIHIVSHGRAGELDLGSTHVTLSSIAGEHADELAVIRAALGSDGDILLYGCDVAAGETGKAFVSALANATGADVAASIDDTGAAARGGDWVLEETRGLIEARSLEAPEWNGLLAPLTISASAPPTVSGGLGISGTTGLEYGGVGFVGLWTNAGLIGGTPIDIRATVLSTTPGATVQFYTAFGTDFYGPGRDADDLWVIVTGGSATIKWEIFASGTNQTVYATGDPSFRISDIDGNAAVNTPFPTNEVESVAPNVTSLTSYTVDNPTNLLTGVSGGNLAVVGTTSQNAEPTSLVGFDWTSVSSWQVTYSAQPGWSDRYFFHDGDGDFTFVSPVTTYMLGVDLDANNSSGVTGTGYQATYTENGTSVAIADVDRTITQHAALGANLDSATVTLTNAQAGDRLLVAGSPAASGTVDGVSYTVTSSAGQITIALSGPATVATYQSILSQISFDNTTDAPSAVDRNITVSVHNATFNTTSNTAIATIHVAPVNDAPVDGDETSTVTEDVTLSVPAATGLLANASDVDGDPLSVSAFTVAGQSGPFVVGTPYAIAGVGTLTISANGSYSFTPAANYDGAVPVITYTVSDGNGGTNTSTLTLIVAPVNDAPAGTDKTITTLEEAAYTLTQADFGFSDPNDTPQNGFASVLITILPSSGALTLDGAPVTSGQEVSVADIVAGKLVWTPAPDSSGVGIAHFAFHVRDDGGTANGGGNLDLTANTITFNVAPVNDPPVAVDDGPVAVTEDVPAIGNVLGNDSDIDGDPLEVTQFSVPGVGNFSAGQTATIPGVGTLVINANGDFTFTPAPNYFGPVPVATYTVSDGNGGTDTATLTIGPVTPVNDPPVAVDDGPVAAIEDQAAFGNVLPNDSDIDGGPLSVTQFTVAGDPTVYAAGSTAIIPGVGALLLNSNGGFIFTPAPNYFGPVPVATYTVSDGNGGTDTATLTIGPVTPVNDPPVAVNDGPVAVTEDVPAVGNVLGNDSDIDGDPLAVTQFSVPGAGIFSAGQTATIPGVGTLVINANGAFTFTPAPNYNGPVPAVTYTITDGNSSASATLSFADVTPVNDPPAPLPDAATTPEDTPLSVDAAHGVLANDTDVEGGALEVTTFTVAGDPIVYAAGEVAAITGVGLLGINADGSYHFVPAANYNGPVPVATYTVSDGTDTATSTLAIVVTPVDDAPVLELSCPPGLVNGSFELFNPTTGVPDGWTAAGSFATVTGLEAGIAPYQPANAPEGTHYLWLNDGAFGIASTIVYQDVATVAGQTYTLTYEQNSEHLGGLSNTSAVAVYADGVLLGTTTFSTIGVQAWESHSFSFTATGTTTRIEFRDVTNYGGNGWQSGSPTLDNVVLSPLVCGPYETTFTENGAPVAIADVTAEITDVDDTNIEQAVITLTDAQAGDLLAVGSLPAGITASAYDPVSHTIRLTGSASLADYALAIQAITFANTSEDPSAADRHVSVTVSDGELDSNTAIATIHVVPVNDPPVAVDDITSVSEDGPPTTGNVITGAGTDTDVDGGPLLVVSADQGGTAITIGVPFVTAGGGVLTLNADGSYTFVPGTAYNGLDVGETATETITYTISDGNGGTATATLVITVVGANDAPVVVDPSNPGDPANPIPAGDPANIIPDVTTTDGATPAPVNVGAYIVDPDGEPLTFTATGLPPGMVIDPVTGIISGTLPADASQSGPYTVTVTATDPDGASVQTTVTYTVVNLPPVAVDDAASVGEDAASVSGNVVTSNDHDTAPDSDPLAVVSAEQGGNPITIGVPFVTAGGGVLTLNADGSYTFVPGTAYNGLDVGETATDTIGYTISDGNGGTATATLVITVVGANDAPVAVDDIVPVTEDTPVSGSLIANDQDPENDPLIVIGFTVDGIPHAAGETVLLPEGTLTIGSDGSYAFTPAPNYHGPVPAVTYTIADDGGATSTANLVLGPVAPVNDPPVPLDDTATTLQDHPLSVSVLDNDGDVDGDPLAVVMATSSDGTVVIAPDGTLTFTPSPGFHGTATITYVVSDGQGGTATATVRVTVLEVPHLDSGTLLPPPAPMPVAAMEPISVDGMVLDTVAGIGGLHSTQSMSVHGIVVDTVEGIASLGGTPGADQASRSAGAVPLEQVRVWQIEGLLRETGAGRALTGAIPGGLYGFSLRLGLLGELDDATARSQIIVETLVRERTLIVSLSSRVADPGRTVTEYRVMQGNGAPLPAWLSRFGNGLLVGQRPADLEGLTLRVIVIYSDGTSEAREVRIEASSGEIQPLARPRGAGLAVPFAEQFARLDPLSDESVRELAWLLAG